MKILFFFLLFPAVAHSQTGGYVQETAYSSAAVYALTVGTAPGTAVQVDSTTYGGILGAIETDVSGFSTNKDLVNCGYQSNVSTKPLVLNPSTGTVNFNNYGVEVGSTTPMRIFKYLSGPLHLWCLSQSSSGSTNTTPIVIHQTK